MPSPTHRIPGDTKGLLILPEEWEKVTSEYQKDYGRMRFADIRKSSGRVGERRWRNSGGISSITLMEGFVPQKRWYRALICYNLFGQQKQKMPPTETLYMYLDAWTLHLIMEYREDKLVVK